jgi:4'-phosphopantetheinyl transferase
LISPELRPGEVHLWTVFHHNADGTAEQLGGLLSPDELALRARLEPDRARRFTTTRGTLRLLLGGYARIQPERVRFRYGPRGKPFLVEDEVAGDPRIQFNLSDSSDVVVFGFSSDREIGVDIERIRHVERWESIARRFFGPEAAEELAALTAADRDAGFIGRWVMEEARIKATGQGIWSRKSPEAGRLNYHPFTPAEGYRGAVAAPGNDWKIISYGVPG